MNRHPISPYIYGINYAGDSLKSLNLGVSRWGGDGTSEYNWSVDKSSTAADWYFEIFAQNNNTQKPFDPVTHNNSAFDLFYETNHANGVKTLGTIPIMGWVAGDFPDKTCSYSVKKYGAQKSTDQYAPDCGNGYRSSDGSAITTNDPKDTDVQIGPSFMTQWVQHVVTNYGTAAQGGVGFWEMDNEPVFWNGVHMSIHPNPSTYDEVTNDGLTYAQAVKAADPTASVNGPVTSKWEDLFFSALDISKGYGSTGVENWKYWNNPVDRDAHGNLDFVAYYLQQFAAYEKQHGQRLLDYLDIHAYVPGIGGVSGTDATGNATRLESTRLLWDTSLIPFSDPNFSTWQYSGGGGSFWDEYLLGSQWKQCLCLIPRMKNWVAGNYPGTKLAITEYNFGDLNNNDPNNPQTPLSMLNGALAQADGLGIFGREGLDLATLWGNVNLTDPAAFAFMMYRNYDGNNSTFGETSISATSADQSQLAIYGAQRADSTMTLMVINKTAADLSSTISLGHYAPSGPVQVWQYAPANLASIVQGANLTASSSGISSVFPANSITLLVVPPSDPLLTAVVNAANPSAQIAPGTLVLVEGSQVGAPDTMVADVPDQPGTVASTLENVQALFDGTAAPIVSVGPGVVTTVVPYEVGAGASTQVTLKNSLGASASLSVPVVANAPAIFTMNGTGSGQAVAFSTAANGTMTLNSASGPTAKNGLLSFYITGAGAMSPAASDGQVLTGGASKQSVAATLSVTIDGLPAALQSATAAPGIVSGVVLVTVTVPSGANSGPVALGVQVGSASSPSGVTVAIK